MLVTTPPAVLADGFWMLGRAAYPLYLFQNSGETAIFEGGTGAMAPVVAEQIDALGIDRAEVRQLIVTHAHPDHVMAVPRLRAMFPRLAVAASAIAARALADEKSVGFFVKVDDGLTAAALKMGAIREDQRPQPLAERQLAVDRIVAEGDTIAVGDARFQVLETPGHSECSLSFFEPQRRILVISDATGYYMPAHNAWWPNYFADYGAYVRSIERLAAVGAEVLCLSHNAAICGAEEVQDYFARGLAATRQYHERIVAETRQGKPARQIAEELGTEIHQRAPLAPVEFFQKNCGLLVKLSLKHEGMS